jgi:large subunit ribosomal protein LP0
LVSFLAHSLNSFEIPHTPKMSGGGVSERKQNYFAKLNQFLEEYPKIILALADNVGSKHMQMIRKSLRGKAVLLMGKNTMARKALRQQIQQNPQLESLLPHVKANVGFIFTKEDLGDIKKIIEDNKVDAPAKAGAIAPCDVNVPPQNTGLEPTKTSFFQALNIPTKIAKGQIEIMQEVSLLKEGDKVGNSEAALLQMLNIRPFKYGLIPTIIYDSGVVYEPKVLDITKEDIFEQIKAAARRIASIGLEIGYPTIASVPHSLVNGYKKVLAVALETNYSFPHADQIREYLENPEAFAAPAAASAPAETAKEEAKAEKEEEKEESDDDMGFGLFD